jgi:hypothetical protein
MNKKYIDNGHTLNARKLWLYLFGAKSHGDYKSFRKNENFGLKVDQPFVDYLLSKKIFTLKETTSFGGSYQVITDDTKIDELIFDLQKYLWHDKQPDDIVWISKSPSAIECYSANSERYVIYLSINPLTLQHSHIRVTKHNSEKFNNTVDEVNFGITKLTTLNKYNFYDCSKKDAEEIAAETIKVYNEVKANNPTVKSPWGNFPIYIDKDCPIG